MRSRKFIPIALLTALAAIGAAACGSKSKSSSTSGNAASLPQLTTNLTGAGATFPEPLYKLWAQDFQSITGGQVNYQGIGSGGGVAQFTAKTVDFGASDVAMTDAELAAAQKNGPADNIPTVFGSVTVAYNVKGIDKNLKLDGSTIADMFLGKIEKWNDPEIAKQNSGVSLPSTPISIVHRSDESGTTGLFTQFLTETSPAWKAGPGEGKTVKWPTGTGGKGNPGVAAGVKGTNGAVGYVELAYAVQSKMTTADVKNKDGSYVAPTLASTTAAGEGISVPADLRFSAINASGADAYPIASATFMLVYEDPCKAAGLSADKAKALKTWLTYAMNQGQQKAPSLQYAPLPSGLKDKAVAKIDALQCNGQDISLGS